MQYSASGVADAETIDGDRLDQGEHALARVDSELADRFSRDTGEKFRAGDVESHVDARAGTALDRSDAGCKYVQHAEPRRTYRGERDVLRADAHAHTLAHQRVDVGGVE